MQVRAVLAVQWALHSAYTDRIQSMPLEAITGWVPPTAICRYWRLLGGSVKILTVWGVIQPDDALVREMMPELVRAQEE